MKKILLWFLNLGNDTPISPRYAMIDNINCYSHDFLVESGNMEPEITLQKFMWEMEQMNKCMESRGKNDGLCVMENGVGREATEKDIYDATHL